MKALNEIIKQEPVFLNIWSHKIDVISDFEDAYLSYEEYIKKPLYMNEDSWIKNKQETDKAIEKYKDINILFASYEYENYSGDAWVLFEQDGKLYEVNGSHCSCYGLEGQWEPEQVSLKELEHRLLSGTFGIDDWSGNNFKQELCEFLGVEFIKDEQQEEI